MLRGKATPQRLTSGAARVPAGHASGNNDLEKSHLPGVAEKSRARGRFCTSKVTPVWQASAKTRSGLHRRRGRPRAQACPGATRSPPRPLFGLSVTVDLGLSVSAWTWSAMRPSPALSDSVTSPVRFRSVIASRTHSADRRIRKAFCESRTADLPIDGRLDRQAPGVE